MKDIYFIANIGNNHQNIINSGSGASEFLFYLTAKKLSKYFNITIINRYSHEPMKIDNIQYLFLPDNQNPQIENINNSIIIVQRNFDTLIYLHKNNPNNRYILWSHDHLCIKMKGLIDNYSLHDINNFFFENNINIISVSNFHKNNIQEILHNVKIYPIYNALFKEYYKRDENIVYNKNSIIFASSWSKGLDKILKIGAKYYIKNKDFKLILIKPSYCGWEPDLQKYIFVEIIGTIKNKIEYCELIQKNLCVLTTSFKETFGCVFAEALFLNVPVIGDNSINAGFHEIIQKDHLCNFNNIDEVIQKIEEFRENRPIVQLDEKFLDTSIIQEWVSVLQL